jgi:hypothetical protein
MMFKVVLQKGMPRRTADPKQFRRVIVVDAASADIARDFALTNPDARGMASEVVEVIPVGDSWVVLAP